MTDLEAVLEDLRAEGLLRELRTLDAPQGAWTRLDGRRVLVLCSNDYLGLAAHPAVREAAAEAALRWGAGAGSSRLVCGSLRPHADLEAALAEWEGTEACVLLGSGYLANVGVVSALAGPDDVVLSDALNHASIVDGCRLARARTVVYPHVDLDALAAGLRDAGHGRGVIVTDAVFSMDGDVAPLTAIAELARRHGARLVVDQAHATGVVGARGEGLVAELGLQGEVDVVIGTLSKALGSYGAFACCDARMRQFLVNRARTLIYSTAPPPPAVAAAHAALELLRAEPSRVARLHANARALRAALGLEPEAMPIVPVVLGAPEDALEASARLLSEGVLAQAIRPPTVPPGTSRLRLVATAAHEEDELARAARSLRASLRPGLATA